MDKTSVSNFKKGQRKICSRRQNLTLASILFCSIYCVSKVYGQAPDGNRLQSKLPIKDVINNFDARTSSDSNCDLFYIIVSTIDGKVSALDLHQKGKLAWTIPADLKPLYSSSLANMEMVRNGKKMRLIPSLDGALYQYDGEKVEAIPMSAETLLSSTYRLSDDSMVVGSKDIKNFGVDIKTGQLIFHCGSDGCHRTEGTAENGVVDGNNVLVITRNTQVVRSVDIKNGHEKWNFSVGQHEVRLPPASKTSQIEDDEDDDKDDDETNDNERIPIFTSFKQCAYEERYAADADYENFLRLVVPDGRVVALDKEDSSSVNWEHKFDSPLAKAWLYRNGQLETLSLFDGRHVPTINAFSSDDQENESMPQPLLYIGSHQKLLYIQPSPQMETVLRSFPSSRIGHVLDSNIQVAWRPYLNTASARTPIFSGNEPGGQTPRSGDNEGDSEDTSLSVWHEDYPFDTGYFLYPEFKDSRSSRKGRVMLLEDLRPKSKPETAEPIMGSLPVTLWKYWKEVIFISLVMSVTIHFALSKFTNFSFHSNAVTHVTEPSSESSEQKHESQESLSSNDSVPDGMNFTSRFESDFDNMRCLGAGGFGVVFEAVNKVDDQHYAVKRIMLPKSDGAKEKVLREVRALAKLDHTGIVRFFNAWVESPPVGWQEERDKQLLPSDLSCTNISPSPSLSATPQSKGIDRLAMKRKKCLEARARNLQAADLSETGDPKPGVREEAHLGADSTSDSVVFASQASGFFDNHPAGSSGEFSVHSNLTSSASGSRSAGHQLSPNQDLISFGFDGAPSSGESSDGNSRSSVPFSNYSSTSSVAFSSGNRPNYTDNDMTGDSVVFESSSHTQSTGTESVVFADISRKQDLAHISSGVISEIGRPPIDFTLSSHYGESKEEKEKDNLPSKSPKNNTAKLYLYIQMQLYQEDTLKEWLAKNTLSRDRQMVLTLFDEIVCAVDYVHKHGLMHRDLKPSNIFFSADGHVKVGDFGLATAITVQQDQEAGSWTSASDKHTAEVGTTLYMSPEQIANQPYDLKVDIFSLGLIFLELWVPFATQMERINTLQAAKKQSLPERFLKELPTESNLVHRMISKDPSHRPITDEILDHFLFEDIAPLRTDPRSRKRTVSEKSS